MSNGIIKPGKPVLHSDYYAGLELSKEQVGDNSRVEKIALQAGFREQTKRHITIIGGPLHDALEKEINSLPDNEAQKFLDKVKALLEMFDWNYSLGDVYKINKTGIFTGGEFVEYRESYIRLINMPDMEKFFEEMNKLLGINIATQYPHITLYTKGERENPHHYGIAVPSEAEFEKMNPVLIEKA